MASMSGTSSGQAGHKQPIVRSGQLCLDGRSPGTTCITLGLAWVVIFPIAPYKWGIICPTFCTEAGYNEPRRNLATCGSWTTAELPPSFVHKRNYQSIHVTSSPESWLLFDVIDQSLPFILDLGPISHVNLIPRWCVVRSPIKDYLRPPYATAQGSWCAVLFTGSGHCCLQSASMSPAAGFWVERAEEGAIFQFPAWIEQQAWTPVVAILSGTGPGGCDPEQCHACPFWEESEQALPAPLRLVLKVRSGPTEATWVVAMGWRKYDTLRRVWGPLWEFLSEEMDSMGNQM